MPQPPTESTFALYQKALGEYNYNDSELRAVIKETMQIIADAFASGTESEIAVIENGEESLTNSDDWFVTDHYYRIPTITNGVGLIMVVSTHVNSPRLVEVNLVAHNTERTFMWDVWGSESYWKLASYLMEKKYQERSGD